MSAAAVEATDGFVRTYDANAAVLPGAGHPALTRARAEGLARYRERGWPTLRDEAWRFFDLRTLRKLEFSPEAAGGGGEPVSAGLLTGDAIRLVFVNATRVGEPFAEPARGVTVGSLAAEAADRPDALADALGTVSLSEDNPFRDLNDALWSDGAVIRVARGVVVARPIVVRFLGAADGTPRALHPRVLVVLEDGAAATVVEEYAGTGGASVFTNVVVEAAVGAGASLDHVRVLSERAEDFHLGSVSVRLDRDARYRGVSVALGGRLCRTDLHVHHAGEGSESRLHGLYARSHAGAVDHHTYLDHAVPHTRSEQLYKGILGGAARGVFNGRILIRHGAQATAAEQANQNLLLSDAALVNTNPQLEIFADDVKCKHGATIGQLDEDKLFYLQSRGLPADAARRLLVHAFADEVIDRVEPAPLREALLRKLAEETFRDV